MKNEKKGEEKLIAEDIECIIFGDGWQRMNECNPGEDYTEEERIELIKEYARQKCKEQREICAKQDDYYGTGADGTSEIYEHLIEEQILNAPAPDLTEPKLINHQTK